MEQTVGQQLLVLFKVQKNTACLCHVPSDLSVCYVNTLLFSVLVYNSLMFCWGEKNYGCLIPVDIFDCLCLGVADTYACVPTRMKFRNAFVEIQLIEEHLTRTVEAKLHV